MATKFFSQKVKFQCLVLVCYRNYRYPGCTTRTSVPSQPTALQKPSYKKNRIYKIKNPHHLRPTQTQPNQTQPTPPPPNPPTHPTQPNPDAKKNSNNK